jgi:hypothetical protein
VFCSSNLVVVNSDAMMIQGVVGFVISLYTFKSFYVLSVGIAIRYGLDGPGIEYRWGRDFAHPSKPALGPTQPPIQRVPRLFQG